MLIEFRDKKGLIKYRTLKRGNVRKVAESIQRAHPGHPFSHTYSIVRSALESGREKTTLDCTHNDTKS